jgi:hypothetical protein
MSGTTTVPKVNFVVLNKKDEFAVSDDAAAAAAAAAAREILPITVKYQPRLLSKELLDAITSATDDAAKATAIKAAITAAIEINDANAANVSAVAKDPKSVLILIPEIIETANINLLAKYVKIDDIFDSILKDDQTVILGGKKSKSKKQRKNKANKRKSVRH